MLDIAKYSDLAHPDLVYQGFLGDGVLALPRCTACARQHFPPRVLCPYCGSDSLSWAECSGRGTVYSTSVLTPRDGRPYAVVLVDLDEGPRMMSSVVDGSEVAIGDRVLVRIEDRDGEALPFFERTELEHG